VAAVGAVAALALSACGSDGGDDPGAEEGPIELTVRYWGNFGFDTLKEKYEALNPNVTLVLDEGDFNAQHEATLRNIVANSGAPDVTAIDEGFIVQMKENSTAFVNLLELGAGEYEDDYLAWKWAQSLSADGSVQIGLGTDIGGLAMCYRTDLFEEAGLPTDRDEVSALIGDSWDDFIALGEQYVEATGRPFVDNATNLMNPILGQQPVGYFNTNEELVMEGGPKVAFDIAVDVVEAGLSANIPPWTPEWNEGFTSGSFAVLACPAWMRGHLINEAPDTSGNWDIADIPGPGGNWGGSFWAIPAQGDHIEESYALVEWLIAAEQQLEIFREVGNFPAQDALWDDPAIAESTDEFFNDAPVGQIFTATAQDLQPQYQGAKAGVVRQQVENVLTELQNGAFDRQSGWEEAVARAQREAEL
jgi:cellobiose transport system substrate-binding protein